jgi:membrane fusion protein (multidrug efflux system)
MTRPGVLRTLAASTAAFLLVLSIACGGEGGHGRAPGAPAAAPRTVATRVLGGGEGRGWEEVPGIIESAGAADIAGRIAAVIEAIPQAEGAFVEKGALLVRLDGRDARARLEAAEAALVAATSRRDRLRVLAAKDAATPQEVEVGEAQRAAALGERDAARAQMEYVEMRAPFSGWITRKDANVGDLAVPGRPIVSLQGTGVLRVATSVTGAQAGRLRPGQALEAVLDDGSLVVTRVSAVAPAGEAASLRFLLKADLPPRSGARAGSFARLRLPAGEAAARTTAGADAGAVRGAASAPGTVWLPRRAVIERGALTGAFVVQEGKARLRWVRLGEMAGDGAPVLAGLDPGEIVVLDPPAGLADGDAVSVTGP